MKRLIYLFFVCTLGIFLLQSCSDDSETDQIQDQQVIEKIDLASRSFRNEAERHFFSTHPKYSAVTSRNEIHDVVLEVNQEFYILNQEEEFIEEFSIKLGVPDWNGYQEIGTGLYFIPTFIENIATGILACLTINDQVFVRTYRYNLLKNVDYQNYSDFGNLGFIFLESIDNNLTIAQSSSTRGECVQPCYFEVISVTDGIGQSMTVEVCQCASGPTLNLACCEDGSGPIEDGGAAEAGGYSIELWLLIIESWFNNNSGGTGNTSSGGGTSINKKKQRVKLINDLVNEQFILDWLLDYLNINIGEDGTNMDVVLLLAGNPQIMNPIYLYLNGYYPNVTVNPQYVNSLINLLINHNINLDNLEIEHILSFEPELIADIQTFLDDHPNDPLAIQIVHDFIELQYCDTENPCVHTDYENEFEDIYNFYNTVSPNNINWLLKIKVFLDEYKVNIPLLTVMSLYQDNCVSCNENVFEVETISILAEDYMAINTYAQQASDVFLSNYEVDDDLLKHRDRLVFEMMINPEYAEYIESSFGWSGIMWTIAKEIIGDKVIDLVGDALLGGAKQDVLDAIKAAKNGDPFGVIYNAVLVVGKQSPLGKALKAIEISAEMVSFVNKISKVWNKIENYTEEAITYIWNIAKKSPVRINADYWKYIDDLKIPKLGFADGVPPYDAHWSEISDFYRKKVFKKNFPDLPDAQFNNMEIHHALPQSVKDKYPSLNVTPNQMHSLENLRGIPKDLYHPDFPNSKLHPWITGQWTSWFNAHPNASLQQILDKAKEFDDAFGDLFVPPIR